MNYDGFNKFKMPNQLSTTSCHVFVLTCHKEYINNDNWLGITFPVDRA